MDAQKASQDLPRLIDASELSEALGYPKSRIYELVRQGEIPHVRFGRAVRFDPVAVREWIDAGGTAGNGTDPEHPEG